MQMIGDNPASVELDRRRSLWQQLQDRREHGPLRPNDLREPGIYGGAQGIWVDKARTSALSPDDSGVTVSVLHTGSSYDDDLADDCILYHYPSTNRPASRDEGEVQATKNAARLNLPVFVITYPSPSSQYREVQLAWIDEWDDDHRVFLITFGDSPPGIGKTDDSTPFQLTADSSKKSTRTNARSGQQRFKFHVFKRYGPSCSVCGLDVTELLDAAHLMPKAENGTDDPRNGIVLCATHHRAFDAGHFGINPETNTITAKDRGPSLADLRITMPDINGLRSLPHPDALGWCWERFEVGHG